MLYKTDNRQKPVPEFSFGFMRNLYHLIKPGERTGFNGVSHQFTRIAMYDSGRQTGVSDNSTSKYRAADKHVTPPSHFKLTLVQPALL